MLLAIQKSGVEQAIDRSGRYRPVGNASLSRLDLHEGFEPEQAPRAIPHDDSVDPALHDLPFDRARNGVGPHGERRSIARNVDSHYWCLLAESIRKSAI